MKKILFLLLFTSAMYGQIVPTGQEQDFDYGIKNTASQLDDNAVFITVQNSDGVQGKSTSSVWAKKIYVDNADVKKAFLSTGLIKNGLVQANADPTKFNITAGIGVISNFDDPNNPTSTIVSFPAFTGITPTYLTSGNITYIAINSSATIVQQATPFTNVQRRDYIILGAVIHSNLSTINLVNNISAPTNAGTNQLHDLMEAIGALNVDGNKITANGANLSINKTAGDIFKLGVNFANDWKNPHKLNLPLQTLATFRYRTQNGTEGANVTALNPALYDVANVLTAVPSNKFSIQTVTLFQTGAIRVQYGQATYATLSEAESAINTRTYNVEPNIAANGITRAYIILKNTATSLQNASDTKIVEAGKFGNVGGSGGAITLDAIVAALGYTPENVANKSGTLTASSTLYPTNNAVIAGTILNQNASAQSANMWINGNGIFGNQVGIGMAMSLDKLLSISSSLTGGTTLGLYNFVSNVNNRNWALKLNSNNFGDLGFMVGTSNGSNPETGIIAFTLTGTGAAIFSSTVSATSFNGSAALTGTPTAPTATVGTNTTQIATTAFVQAADASKVSLTGNETVAGNKTLSGTTTLNETIIREGYQLKFPKGVMYQSSVGTNALTDNRTVSFPDASGTVALVETVRPYKVYTALLSQSGTSAPTATVLENTLGTVVWTRSNTGQYVGTLTGAFTDQKTIIFVNRSNPAATAFDTNMAANVININTVGYTTFSNSAYVDGQTNSASIEIRVYN